MWLAEPTQTMIEGFFRTRAEREELRFTEERQKKEMRRLQKKNLPVRPQKTKQKKRPSKKKNLPVRPQKTKQKKRPGKKKAPAGQKLLTMFHQGNSTSRIKRKHKFTYLSDKSPKKVV